MQGDIDRVKVDIFHVLLFKLELFYSVQCPRQDHERFLNNNNIIWRADVAVILYSLLGAQPWQLM